LNRSLLHFQQVIFFILAVLLPSAGRPITPVDSFNNLVAGGDCSGFKDGPFYEARFSSPSGLAVDEKGDRLFVADSGNHRIRVVYLHENNRVETLAGTGTAGKADGPLASASFNGPNCLSLLPSSRLAVGDAGNGLLRLIDLASKKTSTLAAPGKFWNMAYSPKEDSLYLSLPKETELVRLDLKTARAATLLLHNDQLPHPKALCWYHDKICVADADLPTVYGVDAQATTLPSRFSVSLTAIGSGDHITELAASDGLLYALQAGKDPLARVAPAYAPVSLATPWDFIDNNAPGDLEPLLQFQSGTPVGFAASTIEARKLLIAYPGYGFQNIISVKDYDFDSTWYSTDSPLDFRYPVKKPPKTFRILMLGDSRLVNAPTLAEKEGKDPAWKGESLRIYTIPKRLELILNTEAALRGSDIHFEVLMLGHPGQNPAFFGNTQGLEVAKDYDVDLVLSLWSMVWMDYYSKPVDADGVPKALDGEYLLKPLSSRIPPGAPTRFYRHCLEKGWCQEGSAFPSNDYGKYTKMDDPEVYQDLLEMIGHALQVFSQRLQGMKTSGGLAPKCISVYVPHRSWPQDIFEDFWRELCGKYQVPLIDIAPAYNTLKTSFYPVNERDLSKHYTAMGDYLIAELLARSLIEEKDVPFDSTGDSVPGSGR